MVVLKVVAVVVVCGRPGGPLFDIPPSLFCSHLGSVHYHDRPEESVLWVGRSDMLEAEDWLREAAFDALASRNGPAPVVGKSHWQGYLGSPEGHWCPTQWTNFSALASYGA